MLHGKMMNSLNSDYHYHTFAPPVMSYVSNLDATTNTNHQLWDNLNNSNAPETNTLCTSTTTFLDCPPPPLLPTINAAFPPYYDLSAVPEFQQEQLGIGMMKAETENALGFSAGRIGLNLGHRTYFSSADALFSRSRGLYSFGHHQLPRCQVDGCKTDLTAAKNYHKRHKVCEFHSKAAIVVTAGFQQRFCQQCSRFHVLADFDEAKRSCRKRLADHNRRRRKPQLQTKLQSSTNTTAASKSTSTKIYTPNSSTNASANGHHNYLNKGNLLRINGPELSLGAVERTSWSSFSTDAYQSHHESNYMSMSMTADHETSQPFSSKSASIGSPLLLHHNNHFNSINGNEDQHHHYDVEQNQSSNLLHIGQAMFEVDYL